MPHLLLIAPAGSYRVADHLTAARDLGCDVTVVTNAAVAIAGSALTASFSDPERTADAVIAACGQPVDAVVGTDGDAVAVAGAIARRCGLPANSPAALTAADNKLAQRRALARADVPQPASLVDDGDATAVDTANIARMLPAVVKPIDRTASQGVVRADTTPQVRDAIIGVRRLVGPTAPVLVEQFVDGMEVAVDGLLRAGQLQVLAVFDKPDTPTGPTFPETLLISPARLDADVHDTLIDVVRRVIAAVGLTEGPVHAECKVDGDRVWFLELAARTIGGLCSRSLRIGGMSVEHLVVHHALGHPLPPAPPPTRSDGDHPGSATGVLMLPVPAAGRLVAVHGVDRARTTDGISDVVITIGPGEQVVPLPDGDRYLGFVFARAATADGCEHALRQAWAQLDVEISDGQR